MAILIAAVIIGISYNAYVRSHTFTLTGDGMIKSEQIQPVNGTVKVTGSSDTDVVFTDTESGEKYIIGYITPGMGDSIQLERGKWYAVEGGGELTMQPVNIRRE